MLPSLFLFFAGLALLIYGASVLVKGASALALTLKISPLVVGLTVVAFGTSSPEIAVCTLASWRGKGDLVMGNIIGSNIFNILLVLGICATISPLIVKKQLIWWDVPILIGMSFLFWLFAWGGTIVWWEGVILFFLLILYLLLTARMGRRDAEAPKRPLLPIWKQLLYIALGITLLAFGSDMLVKSAVVLSRMLGISELFIGLTLLAVGTSLPELAASLAALSKGERDMAVGTLIGSNLFNLLGVLGLSALVAPDGISVSPSAFSFDIPIMVGVAIATLPIFLTGHRISRWEGILFLIYYCLYISYLFLHNFGKALLPYFTTALLVFVFPLTLLSLAIGLVRHFRKE